MNFIDLLAARCAGMAWSLPDCGQALTSVSIRRESAAVEIPWVGCIPSTSMGIALTSDRVSPRSLIAFHPKTGGGTLRNGGRNCGEMSMHVVKLLKHARPCKPPPTRLMRLDHLTAPLGGRMMLPQLQPFLLLPPSRPLLHHLLVYARPLRYAVVWG